LDLDGVLNFLVDLDLEAALVFFADLAAFLAALVAAFFADPDFFAEDFEELLDPDFLDDFEELFPFFDVI